MIVILVYVISQIIESVDYDKTFFFSLCLRPSKVFLSALQRSNTNYFCDDQSLYIFAIAAVLFFSCLSLNQKKKWKSPQKKEIPRKKRNI